VSASSSCGRAPAQSSATATGEYKSTLSDWPSPSHLVFAAADLDEDIGIDEHRHDFSSLSGLAAPPRNCAGGFGDLTYILIEITAPILGLPFPPPIYSISTCALIGGGTASPQRWRCLRSSQVSRGARGRFGAKRTSTCCGKESDSTLSYFRTAWPGSGQSCRRSGAR
jgi:hypothetical protein